MSSSGSFRKTGRETLDRIAFFRDQRTAQLQIQRKVLAAILREEADSNAARLGIQKPSAMSDFERKRVALIQRCSLKTKAYLSLLGLDLKIFPRERIQPDVTELILPQFPKSTTLFVPFGIGLAVSSPLGMIPSVIGMVIAAGGFALCRAAVAARMLHDRRSKAERSSTQEQTDDSMFTAYQWKRNELEIFSLCAVLGGSGLIAASMAVTGGAASLATSFAAATFVPVSMFCGAKVENPLIRSALFSATVPVGLLAGGALTEIYTASQIAGISSLLWSSWTASHLALSMPQSNSVPESRPLMSNNMTAALASAGFLVAGVSPWVGDLHRGFVIFGFPAVSALLAQAYTNKIRPEDVLQYGRTAQGTGKFALPDRHALIGVLVLLAFMTGRAYSTGTPSTGFAVVYGGAQ